MPKFGVLRTRGFSIPSVPLFSSPAAAFWFAPWIALFILPAHLTRRTLPFAALSKAAGRSFARRAAAESGQSRVTCSRGAAGGSDWCRCTQSRCRSCAALIQGSALQISDQRGVLDVV